MDDPFIDQTSMHCMVCNVGFERAHELNVHAKSIKHRRAVDDKQERDFLKQQNLDDEAAVRAKREKLWSELKPIWENYQNEALDTVGGVYPKLSPPAAPAPDLGSSMRDLYNLSRPRPHISARRKAIYKLLFKTCRAVMGPCCQLDVFGSIPLRIDDETSDIDMSVQCKCKCEGEKKCSDERKETEASLLGKVAFAVDTCMRMSEREKKRNQEKEKGWSDPNNKWKMQSGADTDEGQGDDKRTFVVTRVLHARIPVVSFHDSLTDTSVDLSWWNIDKLHISDVMTEYLNFGEQKQQQQQQQQQPGQVGALRCLVFSLRQLAKKKNMCDAYGGYINSFGWTVAAMCFCMGHGVVPAMDLDTGTIVRKADNNNNNNVLEEVATLPDWFNDPGKMLIEFLQWFLKWDHKSKRLTMRVPQGMCDKEADKFEDYTYVCIERPRTPYQNITRQVEKKQWTYIRTTLQTALEKLRRGASIWELLKE